MTLRLFAFGTLKKGFPLHDRGLKSAVFLGNYRTVLRYPLIIAGPWFAPMLINEPGHGRHVKSELYEIDESRLPLLDEMESAGRPGNFRLVVEVETNRGRRAVRGVRLLESACSGAAGTQRRDRRIRR